MFTFKPVYNNKYINISRLAITKIANLCKYIKKNFVIFCKFNHDQCRAKKQFKDCFFLRNKFFWGKNRQRLIGLYKKRVLVNWCFNLVVLTLVNYND